MGGDAVVAAVAALKSMTGCMRRLHNEIGGDMGVPTVEVGGDCIRGGRASSSGV